MLISIDVCSIVLIDKEVDDIFSCLQLSYNCTHLLVQEIIEIRLLQWNNTQKN